MKILTEAMPTPYWDIQGLNTKKSIDDIATNFEAIFTRMIVKEFRKTIPEGLFNSSFASKMYWDMFDMQLSQHLAENDALGLKEYIKNAISTYQKYQAE